jgi:hypothetical protein
MRLDCVISIVIITININKLLSALFLLPRLSSPNIYKYRTVPRQRRNRVKGRADKERRERKERGDKGKWKRKEGGEKSKDDKDAGNEEGVRKRARQSGQYHRLQKALASCVQTGRSCLCSLWTGGWWWKRRSTGTLAWEARR